MAAQGCPGGVGPARAVDSATGVGGGGGQVEPPHGSLRPAGAGDGAQDELLVDGDGAAVQRPTDQILIEGLHHRRREDAPGGDPVAEAGGEAFDLLFDPVGHGFGLARVPTAGDGVGAEVFRDPLRYMRVRPRGLGSGGGAARVGRGHLSEEGERSRRKAVRAHLQRVVAQLVHIGAQVHGSGLGGCRRGPWDGAVEGPVDLECGEVPLEPPHVVTHAGGQHVPGDQASVQAGRGDVCQHCPGCAQGLSVGGAHAQGGPAAYDDFLDTHAAVHVPAQRLQTARKSGDQTARAADRHRPPVLLAEHRHQPAESRTTRRFRQQVRMQSATCQQQPGPGPGELLLGQAAHRQCHEPCGAQPARRTQLGCHGQAGFDWWKRGEERIEQMRIELVPQRREPRPGLSVGDP